MWQVKCIIVLGKAVLHSVLSKENQLCKVCISENQECVCVYVLRENDGGLFLVFQSLVILLPDSQSNLKQNRAKGTTESI